MDNMKRKGSGKEAVGELYNECAREVFKHFVEGKAFFSEFSEAKLSKLIDKLKPTYYKNSVAFFLRS